MDYKLGKLPYVHDSRSFHISAYLPVLPKIPASGDWGKSVKIWGMNGNDKVGDCTVVGMEHLLKIWIANSVSKQHNISTSQVIDLYSQMTGYDGTEASDTGNSLISCLKWWQKRGAWGHKIDAYVMVDPKNRAKVDAAIYLFGGLYAGFALPNTAMEQIDQGKPWTVTDSLLCGDAAPWSAGGHCVLLSGWGNNLKCVTWGQEQKLDYQFLGTYSDELWVCVSLDWFTAQHRTPHGLHGFKYSELMADLKSIQF